MANVDIAALSEAVKQVESGGRRYDSSGKLLTSRKGAQGEMQVMPKTARDPGFGVIPAQSDSPDELARVGRDYLSALVDKYGDVEHALVAYNWGPTNANKWIAGGADKAKLPRETRDYLGKVQGLMPKAAPQVMAEQSLVVEPVKSAEAQGSGMSGMAVDSAGPFSYRAALAASLLGNEAEEEGKDKEETVSEDMSEAVLSALGGTTASSALKNLDLRYRNPFDAVYPQDDQALLRMAEGGDVKDVEKKLSDFERRLTEALYGSKGKDLDPYEAEERAYKSSMEGKFESFPKVEERTAKELLDYLTSVNAMPTVRESNVLPRGRYEVPKYSRRKGDTTSPGTVNVPFSMQDAYGMYTHELTHAADQRMEDRYNALVAAVEAGGRDLTADELSFMDAYNKLYRTPTKLPLEFDKLTTSRERRYRTDPFELRSFGTQNVAQPLLKPRDKFNKYDIGHSLNPHVNATMATEAAIMRDLYKRKGYVPGMADGGEVEQTGMMDDILQWLHENGISPTDFLAFLGTKGQGASLALLPRELNTGEEEELRRRREGKVELGFADGGEVDDPEQALFMGRDDVPAKPRISNEEFIRESIKGLGEYPYLAAGAPVDLATMAMRPFGYDVEKPVMGSEWIKEKATELGVRPEDTKDPRLQGPRMASEMLFSLMNPASAPRATAKALDIATDPKTKEAAKALMKEYMAAKEAQYYALPGASYAVKPKGGVWLPEGPGPNPYQGSPEYIRNSYAEELARIKDTVSPEQYAAIEGMLKSGKVEKYFKNKYATGDDPVRNAMLKDEIPFETYNDQNIGALNGRAWQRSIDRLENEDDPGEVKTLLGMLEFIYDSNARILPMSVDRASGVYPPILHMEEKMSLEGVPKGFQNYLHKIAEVRTKDPWAYASDDPQFLISETVRKGPSTAITEAVKRGEPIYAFSKEDIGFPSIKAFSSNEVVPALATLTPKQLSRMSFEEALITGLKNTKADPLRFYQKDVDKLKNLIKDNEVDKFKPRSFASLPELYKFGTKPVKLPESRTTHTLDTEWVQLTDPRAAYLEGQMMSHSVGGYWTQRQGYGGIGVGGREAFNKGDAVIYSLRDKNTGEPRGVTIEVDASNPEQIYVSQIKGKSNDSPIKYDQDIFELLYALEKKHKQERPDSIFAVGSQYYPSGGVKWDDAYNTWLWSLKGDKRPEWKIGESGSLEYLLNFD